MQIDKQELSKTIRLFITAKADCFYLFKQHRLLILFTNIIFPHNKKAYIASIKQETNMAAAAPFHPHPGRR